MSDIADPSKLKVAELRAELQARGLDTKGNKPVLVERLRAALEEESAANEDESPGGEEEAEEVPQEEQADDPAAGATEMSEDKALESPQKKSESPPKRMEPVQKEPEQKQSEEEPEPTPAVKSEPEDSAKLGYEDAPMEELGDKSETGNGMDLNIKEEDAEVKEEPVEVKEEVPETEESGMAARRGEKRALSRSRSPEAAPEAKKQRPEVEEVRVEDEPDFDKTVVALDWYNSDLSLVISKEDFLSAQPLTMQGFGYVWHGVRATYGFTRGRVFFEVKVEDYLPVPQLEEEEQHPHVLRVGWSVDDAGLTLGEDPFSYGYGGTAKASTDLKFKSYGKTFGKGDILGCFLDLESEPIVMSFTVNGQNQGIAYEISHSDLGDQALFPHILTKNTSFKANFGSEPTWMEPLTGYTFTGEIPLEDRVLGSQGPEKRDDAEVIMMVGLPGAGKTTWVEKYCRENVNKKYNVLGTNALIDRMKVNGLPRRRNYSGRWEALIERCTKCLNKLLELAYKRRRNFIVDQTNVYPSAQRRKMKGFAGFKRRAVVICPTDEDLKKRTEKREKEEGKDVPEKAVLEMKANFKLPEEGELFDSVEFIEVQREESQKLVEQYNKEGEDAGFGQKKGFRGGFADRRGGFMDRRGGYGNRGNSFRGGWDRDRRGGYTDRRDRGGWMRDRDYGRGGYNRDSSRGGYSRDYNRGAYNRDTNRGGYNRDRGSRAGYQNSWNRPQGNQGSQSSYNNYNYGQGWGNQGYGYGQNYSSNWNQQYYQQQQQTQQQQQQQTQPYWGTGYGYGSQGYGSGQQYSTSSTSPTSASGGSSSSTWGQQSGWGGSSQTQWGSNYGKQSWGGSGYSTSSGQRR
ncbi:heterogeneous nuclear ribonucleoprotein U-like protein 1 isoform X2 [Eriocheir sinensis]|uniref:heterogeneous nuclear ribonucleoprotein U-like protein 1 isoform X2 n=1 Tax=Eriocheir sinensis TaxID=95602 RepID=UPI0021C8021A|nr:heterogeneous nuclear ribonucleoprotein U-like protein 1 isoform X2 [Eriocheir sinensis]